jgi:transcriptional regulator GlxA family with amidase domain
VVVVPAHDSTDETLAWLRHVASRADLIMSVCTGAFVLAQTGLLDGKTATTHHDSYAAFQATFPKVELVRGRRFVEHVRLATAGGLTSGIDLALRVVERYLGNPGATATARYMEYERAIGPGQA